MEKREPLYTVGGNVNWYSHYGKQYGDSPKNKKQNYHTIQEFTSEYLSQDNENTNSKRYMYPKVHGSIIYSSKDMEAT